MTNDQNTNSNTPNLKRRDLLPWWIKTFTWIFLVFSIFAVIGILFGLLGYNFNLSLYGINTNNPSSLIGVFLLAIFILKGIVALGLWTEKDWAIMLAKIDTYIGIVICSFVMLIYPFLINNGNFILSFRLELILLIIFLIRLNKITKPWEDIKSVLP